MRVDEVQMNVLAAELAKQVKPPFVIYLQGDLGAGKTTFARAFLRALGHQGAVKSPTYGLLEHYELGGLAVLHLDLYRIEEPGELEFLGIEDLFDQRTILIAEWPEKAAGALPNADLLVRLAHHESSRDIEFEPHWNTNTGFE